MRLKKIVFIILGCVSMLLGIIGIVLPILPTVPFFLVTVFFFANSSDRLHNWFINTKMYKKYLESYVKKEGMLLQTKLTIIFTMTALMGLGFFMMLRAEVYIPCVILGAVWIGHILYFSLGVKTIKAVKKEW